MLVLRRMRAHRAVLAAIAIVALLVAATSTAVLGVLDAQSTAGVRAAFAAAGGDDAQASVTIQVTSDPAAQDAAVRSAIGRVAGGVDIMRAELPHSPADPLRAVWTITPAASVRSVDVPGIAALHDHLNDALGADPATGSTGFDIEGSLSDTAAGIETSIVAAAGVAPIALLLVLVIGVVAIVEPIRLLVRVRQPETVLLRSRGDAAPAAAWRMVVELAMLAIPTSAIGATASAIVVGAAVGTEVSPWTAGACAATTALLALVLGAAFAGQDARRALTRSSANDSGRAGQIVAASVTGLLIAVAAFALWRFTLPDAADGPDPIGYLAVPVALLAIAAIGLIAFGPVAGIWSVTAGASRGLGRALGARQLARRSAVYATMILILGLAAGGLVLASAYGSSSVKAVGAQRELQVGADLRVTIPKGADLSPRIAESLPGVTGVTPLLATTLHYGGADGSLVMSGATTPLPSPSLSAGAIRIDVDASPATAFPQQGTLWLVSLDDGVGAKVDLTRADGALVGVLPAGRWALISIQVSIGPFIDPAEFARMMEQTNGLTNCADGCSFALVDWRFEITGVESGGARSELGLHWKLTVPPASSGGYSYSTDSAHPLGSSGSAPEISGSQAFRFDRTDVPPLAITVTPALAARTGVGVGDAISVPFALGGSHADGSIDRIVDAIPGMNTARAASADLAGFEAQQIAAGNDPAPVPELWIDSSDPGVTAAALRARYGADLPIRLAGARDVDTIADAARNALWVSAIGALALAIIAVIGVAGALIAARRGEGIVLRALGMTARAQGAVVAGEFAAPVAFAAVLGAVGGFLVAWFTVPRLAASSVPDGIAGFGIQATFDWPLLSIAAGAGVALLAIVVLSVGAAVRRAAARAVGGELR